MADNFSDRGLVGVAETHGVGADVVDVDVVGVGVGAGLDAVGVALAEPFESTRRTLLTRRDQGLHGGMQFTYRNPDRSTDPRRILSGARSLVVGALGYHRPTPPRPDRAVGRVAAYARSDHYAVLRIALGEVAEALRHAGHEAVVVADDNALVDREAAWRAGLGWYGKNSNILLPGRGSWFVLGTVVTTARLTPSTPVGDGCGPCRKCLDGCPTGAILAPGVVDAGRCLAWLVQADGDFPLEYREALGDRIYGCDDCQEVCPPNRSATSKGSKELSPARGDGSDTTWIDLVELLELDDAELMSRYGRWYIPRREPRYVRRNALVALGNSGQGGDPQVVSTVTRYMDDPDAMLVRHATWAASRLGLSPEAGRAAQQAIGAKGG